MFILDIGIKDKNLPVDVFTICDEIDQILENNDSDSSGYCFLNNIRDMQFEFNTEEEAEEAKEKINEIFMKYNIKISEDDSYITVYEEEKE